MNTEPKDGSAAPPGYQSKTEKDNPCRSSQHWVGEPGTCSSPALAAPLPEQVGTMRLKALKAPGQRELLGNNPGPAPVRAHFTYKTTGSVPPPQ